MKNLFEILEDCIVGWLLLVDSVSKEEKLK